MICGKVNALCQSKCKAQSDNAFTLPIVAFTLSGDPTMTQDKGPDGTLRRGRPSRRDHLVVAARCGHHSGGATVTVSNLPLAPTFRRMSHTSQKPVARFFFGATYTHVRANRLGVMVLYHATGST